MNHAPRPTHSLNEFPAPEPENVAASLRRISRAARERVQHHALMPRLDKAGFTLARYVCFLAAYYHLFGEIERHIENFLAQNFASFDYRERRKQPWLATDLWHFGVSQETPGLQPVRPIVLPPPQSLGALIGMLYVVESGTLSGQTLARYVGDGLGLTAHAGARFFHGYGDPLDTLKHWQEFGVLADSIRHDAVQRQEAEKMTLALFALIEDHLDDYQSRLGV